MGEVRRVIVRYCNGEHEAFIEDHEGESVVMTVEQYEELCVKAGVEPEYPEPLDY